MRGLGYLALLVAVWTDGYWTGRIDELNAEIRRMSSIVRAAGGH